MIDDLPELLRPMRIVIGLKRTVTSLLKMRKFDSFNSVSMVLALR